jgi:hypothetical protein
MLASLLLLAQQPQTVTFSHPCANSAVVLEALGKELGQPMKPTGSVARDFVLIELHDVPVDVALDKLAHTLNATWKASNGVRYLERTPAQEQQDFDVEYGRRAQAVRDVVTKRDSTPFTEERAEALATTVRDFGDTRQTENWNRFQPIARQLPGHRAMLELAGLLDLDALVRADATLVEYASFDGKQPLPAGSDQVLRDLAKEWATFATAGARVGLAGDSVYLQYSRNAEELMKGLQLSVHLNKDSVLLMLSFLVERQWVSLGYHLVPYSESARVPEWVGSLKDPARLSELATESIKPSLIGEGREGLRQALIEGGTADVALSAPGDLVHQAAQGRNVVAVVPDTAYVALAKTQLPTEAPLATVFGVLFSNGAIVAERDGEWLTVKPASPYSARRARMDRTAFQRMCRYVEEYRQLPLDQFADFVATTVEDSTMETAANLFGRAFKAGSGLSSTGLDAIRLYGLLSRADRAAAKSGRVAFRGRTDFERYALALANVSRNMYDGDNVRPLVQKRPGKEQEAALAALPAGMQWTVTAREKNYLLPYNPALKVGEWTFPMDVESFSVNFLLSQRRNGEAGPDFSRIAHVPGWAVDLGIERLDGNGGGVHFGRYSDPMAALKFGSMNDLPRDLQDEVNAAIERNRKIWGGG